MQVEVFTVDNPRELHITLQAWLYGNPNIEIVSTAQSLDSLERIILTVFYRGGTV